MVAGVEHRAVADGIGSEGRMPEDGRMVVDSQEMTFAS
jgi:hypothetical protein